MCSFGTYILVLILRTTISQEICNIKHFQPMKHRFLGCITLLNIRHLLHTFHCGLVERTEVLRLNLSVWVVVIDNCTWNGFTSDVELVTFASRNLFCKLWRAVWALGYVEESINIYLKELENEPILEAVRSATAGLLRTRVRIPLRVRMFVTFVCCVLCR